MPKKIAILATFSVRTRVIVDIPDDVEIEDFLNSQHCADAVAYKGRENILSEPENYLMSENLELEEDIECPFGTFSFDK